VGIDITQRKDAEDQLKKQKEEIELFLNIIAHDLKNYHATTKGYLDLAIKGRKELKKIKDFLKKARASLLRSSTLTTNVSIMLKQQYAYSHKLQKINLFKAINNTKKVVKELYPRKKIIIESSVDKDAYVLADLLFEELMLNVLTNAIKSDTKKEVKVLIDYEETDDNRCIISVTDHGSGIPKEQREFLFDKFSKYRSLGTGSGIGMYIAKTLVERYHGNIKVENRVKGDYKKGTRIILELKNPEKKEKGKNV
ncbi:MAG: sensor histidine kinase, partial [Candidatus Hodarchaeales archaeon]